MKQVLLILTALLTTYTTFSQNNFELDTNGVTCLCPNANVGDTGTLTINGVNKTFTKRSEQQLRTSLLQIQTILKLPSHAQVGLQI